MQFSRAYCKKLLTCNDHNILLVIFSFCAEMELQSVKHTLFCCQKKKKKLNKESKSICNKVSSDKSK